MTAFGWGMAASALGRRGFEGRRIGPEASGRGRLCAVKVAGSRNPKVVTRRHALPAAAADPMLLGTVQPLDVYVTLCALIGSTAVVKTFDSLAERDLIEKNLSRKLIHTTCGPLFVLSWLFYTQSEYARLLAAVIPFVNGLRLFLIGSGAVTDAAAVKAVSREGDRTELLKGPFYYTCVLTLVTVWFWRRPAGIVALSIMCAGDGLADIVGRRLGRGNALFYNKSKSWAGSGAMLAGSFALSEILLALFASFGLLDPQDAAGAARVLLICVLCSVLESLPVNRALDDNITVPAAALVIGSQLL